MSPPAGGRFGLTDCRHLPSDTATFLVGDTPAPWEAKVAMGARGGRLQAEDSEFFSALDTGGA